MALPYVAKAAANVVLESRSLDHDEVLGLLRRYSGVTMYHTPTMVIYTHDMGANVRAAASRAPDIKHLVCMDGPQDGVEEAEEHDHRDQGPQVVAMNSRNYARRDHDAEKAGDNAGQPVDGRSCRTAGT